MGLHLAEDSCQRGKQFGFTLKVAIVSSRAARVLPQLFGGIQLGRAGRQLVDFQPVTVGPEPGLVGKDRCPVLRAGYFLRD